MFQGFARPIGGTRRGNGLFPSLFFPPFSSRPPTILRNGEKRRRTERDRDRERERNETKMHRLRIDVRRRGDGKSKKMTWSRVCKCTVLKGGREGESAPISKRYPLYIGLALFLFKVYAAVVATAATLLGLDKSVGIAVNYISAPLACQYTTRLRWLFIYTFCKDLPRARSIFLSFFLSFSRSLFLLPYVFLLPFFFPHLAMQRRSGERSHHRRLGPRTALCVNTGQ